MEKIRYFVPILFLILGFNIGKSKTLSYYVDLASISRGAYVSTSASYYATCGEGHFFRLGIPLLFSRVGLGLDGYTFIGGEDPLHFYHMVLPIYLYANLVNHRISKRIVSSLHLFAGGSPWGQSEFGYAWHKGIPMWQVGLEAYYTILNAFSLKLSTTYHNFPSLEEEGISITLGASIGSWLRF